MPLSSLAIIESALGSWTPYIYAVLAYILKCLGNMQVKFLLHLPTLQVLYYRNTQFLFYSYSHLRYLGLTAAPKTRSGTIFRVIMRCLFGNIGVFFHYLSLNYLSISEFVALYQTLPVYTYILAALILKEKFKMTHFVSILVSILGVYLIAQPTSVNIEGTSRYIGVIYALLSALVDSIAMIFLKQVSSQLANPLIVLYIAILGSVFASTGLSQNSLSDVNIVDLLPLWILAFFNYLMQLARNRAMLLGQAGKVSLVGTLEVVFACLVDILIFNQTPNAGTLVGATLTTLCVLYPLIDKLR